MAELYFTVGANYEKVVEMRKQVKRLEETLIHLDKNADPAIVKKYEEELESAKNEMKRLAEEAAKTSDELKKVGSNGQESLNGLGSAAKDLALTMGGMFALGSINSFIGKVVETRGEFQQLEASFKNMLGSEEKANELMSQLVTTAASTPFDLKGVADGAKSLLAYGTEAKDVNETITRLGDIAAGLNIPLGDMTYLFGTTMTQGKLASQDLYQFLGRGIPLADELAKQFGVSKDKVKELVSAGKVGADEVKKALWSMTDEGAKFGGLMDAQSKTILGQISNLEDAIDSMFNSIGQQSEGLISDVISGVGSVVENYEQILDILKKIIIAYGTYKGALIAVSAVQKASAKISYASEIAELQKVIPAKKESKAADIDAAVAKGQLTEAQAKQIKSLREEAQAHVGVLEAEAAKAKFEEQQALEKLARAEDDYKIAEEMMQTSLKELELAEKSGDAQAKETAQKNLNSAAEMKNTAAREANNARKVHGIAASKAATAQTAKETAVTNLNSVSKTTATKVTNLFTIAQKNLKAVIMSNPWGLALTAILALGSALYKLVTASDESAKAIKKVQDGFSKAEGQALSEISRLDALKESLKNLTEGTKQYNEAKQELLSLTNKYDASLAKEIETVGLTELAYTKLAASIKKSAMEKQYQTTMQELQEDYSNALSENLQKLYESLSKEYGEDKGKALYRQIVEKFENGELKKSGEYYTRANDWNATEIQKIETGVKELDEQIESASTRMWDSAEHYINYILNAQEALKQGMTKADDMYKSYERLPKEGEKSKEELRKEAQDKYKIALEAIKEAENSGDAKALKKAQAELDEALMEYVNYGGKSEDADIYKEAKRRALQRLEAAKKAWSEVENDQNATLSDRTGKKTELDEAQKAYDTLTGTDSKSNKTSDAANKRADALKKLAEMSLEDRRNIERKEIDLQDESIEKRKALLALDLKTQQDALVKRAQLYAETNKTAGVKGNNRSVNVGGVDVSGLTSEQAEYIKKQNDIAEQGQTKALAELAKTAEIAMREYRKQYGEYEQKKLAITEEYEEKIAKAQTEGERLILENQKKSELGQLDLEQITKSDAYAKAFSDMGNVSTITLQNLAKRLDDKKEDLQKAFADNPEQMKAFQDMLTNLDNELRARDPFGAMKKSIDELAQAQSELDAVNAELERLRKSFAETGKTAEEYAEIQNQITDAESRQSKAADDVQEANNNIKKSLQTVVGVFGKVYDGLSSVGDAISEMGGQTMAMIGDVLNLVQVSVDAMNTTAEGGARAMSAVEKASVILAIIGAALKVMQKIDELFTSSSSTAKYEQAAEKQASINKLSQTVRDYEAAVLSAKNAEKSWFSQTGMNNLQSSYTEGKKALENYYHKAGEMQEKYVNQKGGTTFLGRARDATVAATKSIVKATAATVTGDIKELGRQAASAATGGWTEVYGAFDKYNGNQVKAIDNLRIETQAARKGNLFKKSKDQQTQDLRSWAKQTFGEDLFGTDGMIDKEMAQKIIDNYGDKLQGQTKETLEQLIAYKEQWDEYIKTLQEYVSEMYSPVVDNMTDALMNWLDTGEDVMDSFEEKAKDTFRSIAQEMVKDMTQQLVFGDYEKKMKEAYEKYAKGELSSKELAAESARLTGEVKDNFSKNAKELQDFTQTVSDLYEEVGVNIKNTAAEQEASKGAFQTMSEDTASELNGRFTALQISGERTAIATEANLAATQALTQSVVDFRGSLSYLADIEMETSDLYAIGTQIQNTMSQSLLELQGINQNTGDTVSVLQNIQTDMGKLRKKIEEM